MPSISVQFHGLPEELLAFVKQCVSDFKLHVVAMRYFPFEAIEVAPADLEAVFSKSSSYRELGFTLRKPALPAKSNTEFYDKNPDELRLDIERVSDKGLRQTWLTASTDNTTALVIWRKIARRLKKVTQAGAVAMNPDTGATVFDRTARHTVGARALELSGVPILPAAGGCIMKLGKPTNAESREEKKAPHQ